jgi:hypothetical protein
VVLRKPTHHVSLFELLSQKQIHGDEQGEDYNRDPEGRFKNVSAHDSLMRGPAKERGRWAEVSLAGRIRPPEGR